MSALGTLDCALASLRRNFLDLGGAPTSASYFVAWRRDGETRRVELVLAPLAVFEEALECVVD